MIEIYSQNLQKFQLHQEEYMTENAIPEANKPTPITQVVIQNHWNLQLKSLNTPLFYKDQQIFRKG